MSVIGVRFIALLLILIVLLLGLSFVIHWLTYLKKGRLIRWLLGGYILVLLLFTIIYSFNPPQANKGVKPIEADVVYNADAQLFQALESKDLNLLSPDYFVKQWTFYTEEDELHLRRANPSHIAEIVIIHTEQPSDEIRILYYRTPLNMDGWDISPYLSLPEINLEKNRLNILFPEEHLHLSRLEAEFPIKQFENTKKEDTFTVHAGLNALLIYLPENKKLHGKTSHSVHHIYEK